MKRVVFSKRASFLLENLLEYLEREWSVKVKKDFIKKMDKAINQIINFPESCPRSEIKKGLHRLIVTRQTTIYYQFDSKSIKIITIFDNRMNPDKLNKELK
jgi:plasmid stabilization system protein ParE